MLCGRWMRSTDPTVGACYADVGARPSRTATMLQTWCLPTLWHRWTRQSARTSHPRPHATTRPSCTPPVRGSSVVQSTKGMHAKWSSGVPHLVYCQLLLLNPLVLLGSAILRWLLDHGVILTLRWFSCGRLRLLRIWLHRWNKVDPCNDCDAVASKPHTCQHCRPTKSRTPHPRLPRTRRTQGDPIGPCARIIADRKRQ